MNLRGILPMFALALAVAPAAAQQPFEIDTSSFPPPAQDEAAQPPQLAPGDMALPPIAPIAPATPAPVAPEIPAPFDPAPALSVDPAIYRPDTGASPALVRPASAQIALQPSPVNPHTFDVDIHAGAPIDLISVTLREGATVVGRHSLLPEMAQSSLSYQTAAFRFLPAQYTAEVEVDCSGSITRRTFGPFSNTIQKMVIVDRDAYPQRVLLVEGDRWLLFGRIVDSSKISSGLNDYGGTPLGYYHIRSKEYFAVNKFQEWNMPFAHWYTPTNYPEGVNGLHMGFPGTIYGIRQSHGCTRMPEEFARRMWDWSEVGIPVIYVGDEAQTKYDLGRFNLTDYPIFKSLIDQMIAYRQGLEMGQESPSYFTLAQVAVIEQMRPCQEDLLAACQEFRRYAQGQSMYQLVQALVASNGAS